MLYNVVRYIIFSSLLFLLSCFPSLEKSPLEIVNLLGFLGNRSQGIRNVENGTATAFVYSKADGELQIQNLNDEPITISENGNFEIPIQTSRGNGTLDFRILTQPTDHECRIINPEENFVSGSTIIEINCFSLLSTTPINGGIIPPLASIVFRFSDTVDFDPTNTNDDSFTNVNLESNNEPDFLLSQTLVSNDTLTVTPQAPGWTPGLGKFIEFNFRNLQGKNFASGGKRLDLTVASALRYVSPSGTDFVNDGLTPTTPFRNIQRAIDDISVCPDKACLVLVEEGSYDASAFGTSILIQDGISITGSFIAGTNFGSRNPSLRNSQIFFPFPPVTCGDVSDDCVPVVVSGVNQPTLLEGFTIQSAASKKSFGIIIENSNLTIANTEIRSGDAAFNSSDSIAMQLNNSNVRIENSSLLGGSCSGSISTNIALSIFTNNPTLSSPIIRNSTIQSGNCLSSGSASYGIVFSTFGGTISLENIENTTIQSGDATEESFGILGFSSPTNIQGTQNISTGNAPNVVGISLNLVSESADIGTLIGSLINITTGSATISNKGIEVITTGDAIIRNTNIIMGNLSQPIAGNVQAYGMNLSVSSVLEVSQNNINMGNVFTGNGIPTARGVEIMNGSNSSLVERNTIRMANLSCGSAIPSGTNMGLRWEGASAGRIVNNIIYGGSTNNVSFGVNVESEGQNLKVYHNTIAMGTTTGSSGKSSSFNYGGTIPSGGLELRNNIFLNSTGTDTCVSLLGLPTGAIQGNVFWNCDTLILDTDVGGFDYPDICNPNGEVGRNSCASPPGDFTGIGLTYYGNLNINPVLDPTNAQLTNSSPCIVTENDNLLPTVFNDRFLNQRGLQSPPTVSLGAVEYMGVCVP